MGCQSAVIIGDNLTFTICTHDPDTGVLTDADAPPAYRVYEDETGAAILNGTMTILDNVNTTGFYSEQIACTVGNGFEHGRSYNIYIEATVDGDTGGISFGFRAIDEEEAVWGVVAEGAQTYQHIMRILLSGMAGLTNGGGTPNLAFRDLADLKNRISETVDASGNRTNVVLDGT